MAPPDKTPQHEDPDASLEVLIERQRTLFEIEDQRLRNIDAHAIGLTASGLAALALAGALPGAREAFARRGGIWPDLSPQLTSILGWVSLIALVVVFLALALALVSAIYARFDRPRPPPTRRFRPVSHTLKDGQERLKDVQQSDAEFIGQQSSWSKSPPETQRLVLDNWAKRLLSVTYRLRMKGAWAKISFVALSVAVGSAVLSLLTFPPSEARRADAPKPPSRDEQR